MENQPGFPADQHVQIHCYQLKVIDSVLIADFYQLRMMAISAQI